MGRLAGSITLLLRLRVPWCREVCMHSSRATRRKRFPWSQIALVASLTLVLSGWTCGVFFASCQAATQLQINSISPNAMSSDAESVLLTVEGSGFTAASQIMWNSHALPTTLMDSHHLETTITQQTLSAFGGSVGSTVQISTRSQ